MLRCEEGRLFPSEVFHDEFTDLAIIYLDEKGPHSLEMKNSDTLMLVRLKGENVLTTSANTAFVCAYFCCFSENIICNYYC